MPISFHARHALRVATRVIRFAAIAAFGLEVLYVLVANVFLSTSLFDKVVNATPGTVDIHYARGWSLFPSRVHATKLSIRGTDSHIEWILRLDHADFDCSLLALLRKDFHVTSAHGSGVTFRLRFKVAAPAATDALLHELPSIDSLGLVGLIPSAPPYAGTWDDARWHLWTVHLENANAEHVREVWIEHARFVGDARVTGGFYLKPIRAVELQDVAVTIREGSVSLDSRMAASHLAGRGELSVRRFDPRVSRTRDILDRVSVSTDASLVLPDLATFGIGSTSGYAVAGEATVSRLALRVADGEVRDGTQLAALGSNLVLGSATRECSGNVRFTAGVEHDQLTANAVVDHIDTSSGIRAPRLTVAFDSKSLRFRDLFGDLHAVVDLPEATLAEAASLADLLPAGSPVRILGGSLRGSAHGEAWRKDARARGSLSIEGTDLAFASGALQVRGDAAVEASADSLRLDTLESLGARATLRIEGASMASSVRPSEPLVRVRGLLIEASAEDAHLKDPARAFRATFEAPDVEVFERSWQGALSGAARRLRSPSGKLRMTASGDMVADGDRMSGTVAASVPDLELESKAPNVRLAGGMGAHVRLVSWDRAKGTLDGSADVAMTGLAGRFGRLSGPADFSVAKIALRAAVEGLDLARPSMRSTRFGVKVIGAEIPDLRSMNALLPSSEILAIDSGRVSISVDVDASGEPGATHGYAAVHLTDAGLILGDSHFSGDFALSMRAAPSPGHDSVVDLGGSRLTMRNVGVKGTSTDASDWAGDLTLTQGHLALDSPKLDAELVLRARDASPILGAMFRNTLPGWVAGWTRMQSLTALTHVVVEPRELAISDLIAAGGNLSVRGTYALRRGAKGDGAFVVHKGPWSAGLDVDAGESHVRLFDLDRWYRARVRAILGAGSAGFAQFDPDPPDTRGAPTSTCLGRARGRDDASPDGC